ncbi:peptidase domain-containing ABC transporter [Desulforhopalus sp. 52FAK]
MSETQDILTAPPQRRLELLLRTRDWLKLLGLIPKFGSDGLMLITASVVINLLALALPLALMQVYDRIIPNSSYSTLGWLMLGVLSAIILETIVKTFRSFISNWLSARLDHILHTDALNRFLSARLDRFEKDNPGVHFERFSAINTIKTYVSGQILLVLLDIPFALLFLSLLYYIGGALCYFTCLLITLFIGCTLIAKSKFERQHQAQIELNKEQLDFTLESLGGIHTVKSLGLEDRLQRKFENIQARAASTGMQANRWLALPQNSGSFVSQFNMMGIIFLGADLVIKGSLTVGAMTACTMLATRGLQPFLKVAGFWLKFSEVTNAQVQLKKIIDLCPNEDLNSIPQIKDVEGTVCFENVSLTTELAALRINSFNATFHAGEFVGVDGRNQEQTTSLMLLLCGMYKPDSGKIFIDEYLISSMDHSCFNGRVEYLPRKGRLFNGTVLDNIAMFKPEKRDTALDTASLFGLDSFVADLPNGYNTLVDQRSNESLPQSLIQRICLARAFVQTPRLLILDRSLNSLDNQTREIACEIITRLKGKCTVFIVSDYGEFQLPVDKVIRCKEEGFEVVTVEEIKP